MSDDGHLTSEKTSSDTDSNSNSGSLFSRRYPDDLSLDSNGSKENSNNENSSSPKLLSLRTETTVTVQRRLLKDFYPESNSKCQPKMTREDLIDLTTNEEKSNSDDEWFMRITRSRNGTHLIDWSEKSENSSQVSLGTTRTDIQKFLMKRLVKLRRSGQEKRKALYDADNGILSNLGQLDDDVCGLTNEESKISEWDADEKKSQMRSAIMKSKGEAPKCDLLEQHEAAELYNDNNEMVSGKNEINGRKIYDIDDKSNDEVNEKNTKEVENMELNEESSRDGGSHKKFLTKSFEDTLDVDWENNRLQSRTKTCESLAKRKSYARFYSAGNETDSSNLSDETTGDSEEDDSRSASLVDQLLDDVAANCSGIFEYPEEKSKSEKHIKFAAKVSGGGNGRDDNEYEDNLMKRHKMPRKRRLVFTPSNSDDEEEKKECGGGTGAAKSVKNVQDLEDDDNDNREGNAEPCSGHKKESSFDGGDDVNALLNGSKDKFEGINDTTDNILFGDEGDDCNKDEIHPTDVASDEEDQQADDDGLEETGSSSDDELKVFHKLQIAQERKKKRFEYIEEEAALSGDDVGSDENDDDEDQLNVYETEEGDNDDELPDDETIREQLHKQWLKQQQEEENRKLLYWKDRLLIDGDLADATDRTFRFKLRQAKSENSEKETEQELTSADIEDVREVDDDGELCKRRREISKWKIEQRKAELHVENEVSMKGTNLLLKAASQVINKRRIAGLDGNSSQLHERIVDASLCKNSLLHHRKSLSQVLNQTKITLYTKPAGPISTHGNKQYTEKENVAKQEINIKSRSSMKKMGRRSHASSQ